MIIAAAAALLTVGMILFTLVVRPSDLPAAPPESPFKHLDERKAAIYDNLRDLQFEYRVGKLSEHDYQQTKIDLQRELAAVLAEVDRLKGELGVEAAAVSPKPQARPQAAVSSVCPHCGAKFAQALKFCGECGKPMSEQKSS
jgi:rRNA maturation endonuclease Nob1